MLRIGRSILCAATISLPLCLGSGHALAAPGDNQLVSVDLFTPSAAGGSSGRVSISANGRYVLFGSGASTLVAGDTNNWSDVFVRDMVTGVTERVSIGASGMEANGPSWPGSITADGRYVVFESAASNLWETNDTNDVKTYVRDRWTGRVDRSPVWLNSAAQWQYFSSISNDGRFVALAVGDYVVLNDVQAYTIKYIAKGQYPAISGNGRYVVFTSSASDLVPNDLPDTPDLFVWDRYSRSFARIARNPCASTPASISRDGRWVSYTACTDNTGIQAYLWDRVTGTSRLVSVTATGVPSNGTNSQTSVSDDGRYVAFISLATNLATDVTSEFVADVYIKDMQSGTLERVTSPVHGATTNSNTALSDDGRFVAFNSQIPLVPSDTNPWFDTYVHETGKSTVVLQGYHFNLWPRTIEFGQVALGAELRRGFRLTNTGDAPLPVTTVELQGLDKSQYAFESHCGSMVEVNGRCWISVTFKPTTLGYKQANLHVTAGGIDRHRALRGTGVP